MERLRAYWASGCVGKIVLSVAGFLGVTFCCGVLVLVVPTPRPIQAPAAAQPTIAEIDPAATPDTIELAAVTVEAHEDATLTQEPTAAPAAPADRRAVRKEDYGDAWPFTVDQGIVRCVAPKNEVVFSSGGKAYAVNGTAKANKLYGDIGQIWRDNPAIEGTKIDISPILNLGLSLC